MLQCKIVACKRHLDAAFGTLGDEATRQQKPDIWQRRRHFFTGTAQIKCKSWQDSRENFQRFRMISTARRRGAVLIAGLTAIVVNTSMLEAPDLIPLVTALPALHDASALDVEA